MKIPRLLSFAVALLLPLAPARAALWIKGCDASSLKKSEDKGGKYFFASGWQDDAFKILKDGGLNTIRLKVWVNSPDGYHNKARILAMAKRAKAAGHKLLIDFHYSDTWADPGHQKKPAAWATHGLSALNTDVYNHTYDICKALASQGTAADYVQIGNEINDGMLWNDGRISTANNNFSNLCQLLRSGINGAKAANSSTAIVLHIAKGGDWELIKWWFDNVKAQGISWDYTGVSYYPYWHGSLSSLQTALNNAAARFAKPVLVVETAYPFTLSEGDTTPNNIGLQSQLVGGYPASIQGQYNMIKKILQIVNAVPNNRGAGIVYWEGTWTPVPGNGWDNFNASTGNNWENQALFDFTGKALWSMWVFREF
jgi:arabinogalactan endo-1,4-beta-galactosidase